MGEEIETMSIISLSRKLFSLNLYFGSLLALLFISGVFAEGDTDAARLAWEKDQANKKAQEAEAVKQMEWNREQERARRELLKEQQDKCEQAYKDIEDQLKGKKGEQADHEEKFYDLEEQITDLEKELSDDKVALSEKLEDLKKTSAEKIQTLKEDMGDELKDIDDEIKIVEESIASLTDELHKIEELRMSSYYKRREEQRKDYISCYDTALKQTNSERATYYQKISRRTLKKTSLSDLAKGGKANTKNIFSQKFSAYLNICLGSEKALLAQENADSSHELQLKTLKNREKNSYKKIAGAKTQIANLKTTKKVEIMGKFQEEMKSELQNFDQSYSAATKTHEGTIKQTNQQIAKIRKQQSYVLYQRSLAVPQKTRAVALSEQCSQVDGITSAFNMLQQVNNPIEELINERRRNTGFLGGRSAVQ